MASCAPPGARRVPELLSLDDGHSTLACPDTGASCLMIEAGGRPIGQSPVASRFNVPGGPPPGGARRVRWEIRGTVGDFIDPDGNRCSLRDEGTFFPTVP